MELHRSCGLNNLVVFRHPCVLIRIQTKPTTFKHSNSKHWDGLVWTISLIVEIKLCFQIPPWTRALFLPLSLPSTVVGHGNGAFRKCSSNPRNLTIPSFVFRNQIPWSSRSGVEHRANILITIPWKAKCYRNLLSYDALGRGEDWVSGNLLCW